MRARSRTVRYIKTHHDLEQKTIRLRSSGREQRLRGPEKKPVPAPAAPAGSAVPADPAPSEKVPATGS